MNDFKDAPIELRTHQKEAVELSLLNKKYALFMEVGTGKTYCGLEFIRQILSNDKDVKNILIVSPLSGLPQWEQEVKFYLKGFKVGISIRNPEKIVNDKEFLTYSYDIIIFDEAHKIKSGTAKISKAMKIQTFRAKYVLSMTGTPVANNLIDIYYIFQNSNVNIFNPTYSKFVDEYFDWSLMGNNYGRKYIKILGIKKGMDDKFKELMKQKAYVKRQDECLDLPGKQVQIIKIPGMVDKTYKELKDSVLIIDDKETTLNILEKLSKLHQAANGFVYDENKEARILKTLNNKIKVFNDLVENTLEGNDQIIVVYNFQADKKNIIDNLKYEYTDDIEEFKRDKSKRILLLQMQNCEAANLQFCKIMIYYSYDWSYLHYNQMNGRIYRMGQTQKVMYYMLVSERTIEEQILKTLEYKKSVDDFVKDVLKKDDDDE